MYGIRAEIVKLPLFAVRNDRRASGFKPFNGVSNGIFIERSEVGILTIAPRDSLDQLNGSWDTADWLGGYRDWRRLGHTYRLAQSIIDLSGVNNRRSSNFPISSSKWRFRDTPVEFRAVFAMDLHGDFAGPELRSHLLTEHAENPGSACGSHSFASIFVGSAK
jgi:hypothetical protein